MYFTSVQIFVDAMINHVFGKKFWVPLVNLSHVVNLKILTSAIDPCKTPGIVCHFVHLKQKDKERTTGHSEFHTALQTLLIRNKI